MASLNFQLVFDAMKSGLSQEQSSLVQSIYDGLDQGEKDSIIAKLENIASNTIARMTGRKGMEYTDQEIQTAIDEDYRLQKFLFRFIMRNT